MVTDQSFSLRQAIPFWEHLSEPQKNLVLTHIAPAHYQKGQMMGDEIECLGLMLIRSGKVCVSMLSEDGRAITLYRLGKDDICVLSASCVLSQITFDVHIEAQEDTDLFVLNAGLVHRLTEENIYVKAFIHQLINERFSDVMWAMQQLLFLGLDRRVARYLYEESVATGNPLLRTTHDQIARHVGSAREVVTRMLNRFADEGVVRLQRGTVLVLDPKQLKKLI
ncbi:MAG: Crp/Fnr family transcriptional regulator [Eubacteriales bacterium]